MIARKVALALAADYPVMVKPAKDTLLGALALAERAGVPLGIINIVTCSKAWAPEVVEELTTNSIVRKVSFTGSTPMGKLLGRAGLEAETYQCPLIDQASLDKMAMGAMPTR